MREDTHQEVEKFVGGPTNNFYSSAPLPMQGKQMNGAPQQQFNQGTTAGNKKNINAIPVRWGLKIRVSAGLRFRVVRGVQNARRF